MPRVSTGRSSRPAVSICVPTYQGAAHLRECLAGALAQTTPSFEVVVVDDGSSDGTLEIARELAAADDRVRVVASRERRGLPGNWNRCFEHARGEWIKFLFQDDVLAPRCVETLLEVAEAGSTLVVCKRRWAFAEDVPLDRRAWYDAHRAVDSWFPPAGRSSDRRQRGIVVGAAELCRVVLDDPGMNRLGEPSSALLHHGVVPRFGGFNPDLVMICDTEYWTRVASHDGFAYVPEELVTFRVHRGSASTAALDHREYRVALDGLILHHDLVFAPVYEPLRRVASRLDREAPLREVLRARAGETWKRAFAAPGSARGDAAARREEWLTMARKYPMIHRLATGEWLDEKGPPCAGASS